MITSPLYWNGEKFPSQNGKPLAVTKEQVQDCCCRHYKCDPLTHVCQPTDEPLTNPNVYSSRAECMANCGGECWTDGCDFQVQFYYEKSWGGHQCDRAIFDAYCGDRLLGEVNLNNGDDGGSRYSAWFGVAADDFDVASCSYTFRLVCKSEDCHAGIAGLKFSNDFDLPAMSGDEWSVFGNDVCPQDEPAEAPLMKLSAAIDSSAIPSNGGVAEGRGGSVQSKIQNQKSKIILARIKICKSCDRSNANGNLCSRVKIKNCGGQCFSRWRANSDNQCPLGKWPALSGVKGVAIEKTAKDKE